MYTSQKKGRQNANFISNAFQKGILENFNNSMCNSNNALYRLKFSSCIVIVVANNLIVEFEIKVVYHFRMN